MRLFAAILILCGLFGGQAQAQGLSEPQKKEVEALIGDYLRTNPEIILQAIRTMQEREQAALLQRQQDGMMTRRNDLENDPASPVVGNPQGDITVVEFFDYRCPYCKTALPTVQRLLKEDRKVRYVMKELPILSPESRIAAKVALAVWNSDPNRYFDVHSRLMEARGDLTEKRIFEIAKSAGVDIERTKKAMEAAEIDKALAANLELAQTVGVTGTPGFVVGNHLVPGAVDYATLKRLVAEARRGS